MFTIKKYLQYKNTPDGKPRVLTEGVDYEYENSKLLYKDWEVLELSDWNNIIKKEDCRPLLTVEIEGKEWTEGDVSKDGGIVYFNIESIDGLVNIQYSDGVIGVCSGNFKSKIIGSFFDDPAKCSEWLWNCNEEEGWGKVLKLLNIN
jgi:hypothetical protein